MKKKCTWCSHAETDHELVESMYGDEYRGPCRSGGWCVCTEMNKYRSFEHFRACVRADEAWAKKIGDRTVKSRWSWGGTED